MNVASSDESMILKSGSECGKGSRELHELALRPEQILAYDKEASNGRFGGVTIWQRFAYKKANRWKMLCADSSGRCSRRTSSRK